LLHRAARPGFLYTPFQLIAPADLVVGAGSDEIDRTLDRLPGARGRPPRNIWTEHSLNVRVGRSTLHPIAKAVERAFLASEMIAECAVTGKGRISSCKKSNLGLTRNMAVVATSTGELLKNTVVVQAGLPRVRPLAPLLLSRPPPSPIDAEPLGSSNARFSLKCLLARRARSIRSGNPSNLAYNLVPHGANLGAFETLVENGY